MPTPELGAFIRRLRENRTTLSLRAFARELDLSASFICDVELGRRVPSKRRLRQMAEVLEPVYRQANLYDQLLVKAGKMSPERCALLVLRKVLRDGLNGVMLGNGELAVYVEKGLAAGMYHPGADERRTATMNNPTMAGGNTHDRS